MKYNKYVLSICFVLVLCTTLLSAVESGRDDRFFTIGVNLAFASPTYSEPLDSNLEALESTAGVDRTAIGLGLEAGFALTQDAYFIFGVEGSGDRFEDTLDYMQLNTYLYFLGVKAYPFHTGLVLEGKVGASRMVLQSSMSYTEASSIGLGYGATIGYDFDRNSTGAAFETGLTLNILKDMMIEDTEVSANNLFLYGKLLWK